MVLGRNVTDGGKMIDQLIARWAVKQPEVCRPSGILSGFSVRYQIGEYEFYEHPVYGFSAVTIPSRYNMLSGQPALDWLTGCVIRAIEASGKLVYISSTHNGGSAVSIGERETVYGDTHIVALLTAYVEYLEAQ